MKRNFIIQMHDNVRSDLEKVAAAAHMDETKFIAVWAEELSTLKPEFALKALGLIPPEWKQRRPGRPSAPGAQKQETQAVEVA